MGNWARNSVGSVGDNIGLPDVTSTDNGKTVVVEDAEWTVGEGGSGGGGLPEITEADEGKFLGVVSGEAAWANPGGGSVLLITDNDGTLNKTAQEIADAFTSGSLCLLVNQTADDGYIDIIHSLMVMYGQSLSESEGNYYGFTFVKTELDDIVTLRFSCTDLSDYPEKDR